MTKLEFLQKAKEKGFTQFDYSKIPEKWTNNSKIKIEIGCPEHGFWKTTVFNFLSSKKGCPKCAGCAKLSTKDFIKKAKKIHGDKYDYSKVNYVDNETHVCIICPKHGEFWQSPHSHTSNHARGCKKCAMENRLQNVKAHNKISTNNIDLQNVVQNPIITDSKHILGTIYCFVNKTNNKKYIGKVLRSNYTTRFSEHRKRSHSNCVYFYRALTKYGWESFDKYILFQTPPYSNTSSNKKIINNIISKKEIEFIKMYQTNNSEFGYNLTTGGDGVVGYVFSEETRKKMSESHKGNKHWNYGNKNSAGHAVLQFTLDGILVAEHLSIQEAHRCTGIKSCCISNCCSNNLDTAGGYIWVKKSEYFPGYIQKYKSRAKCKSNDKAIYQYDLCGNFIKEYISVVEAAKDLGNTSYKSMIAYCANGKSVAAFKYIYIFKEDFSKDNLTKRVEAAKNFKPRLKWR